MTVSPHDLEFWRILESLAGGDSLLDFIPRVTPRYMRPNHLAPLADALTRARHGPVKVCVSVPPRFSKTETILHSIAWRLDHDDGPETEIAYCTYEATLAHQKSKLAQEITKRAGIPMRSGQAGFEWRTDRGAAVRATGVGGPLTGKGAKLLIIDDPTKNREEAESGVIREKIWNWATSTAFTRVEPGGSIVVCHTRWHDDDLIGRLMEGTAGDDWEFINLAAVVDEGTPDYRSLWPERWPLQELDGKRRLVGAYDWSSLYMGEPRPRGGRVFQDPARYKLHDPNGCFYVIGCDPAATEKTSADHSVAVVLASRGRPGTLDHHVEVVDVWRGQVEIPALVKRLKAMQDEWNAPIAVEAVGGFKAVPQMLREVSGVRGKYGTGVLRYARIFEVTPSTDKFVRSQSVAAVWNDQRIKVPVRGSNPWVDSFVNEVTKFTGVKDAKDDQVDALAHAYNAISMAMPLARGIRTPGWREI